MPGLAMAGYAGQVPALHTKLLRHPAPLWSPPTPPGVGQQPPPAGPSPAPQVPGRSLTSRKQLPPLVGCSWAHLPLPCRPWAPLAAPRPQPGPWGPGPCPARAARLPAAAEGARSAEGPGWMALTSNQPLNILLYLDSVLVASGFIHCSLFKPCSGESYYLLHWLSCC